MNHIFVSHKSSNAKLANDIIEILKSGMGGVDFFLSEKITPGENWRSDITKAIRSAECLLLLYLDPDQDWRWCMFEAGLFSACKPRNGKRRLYCIHYPDSPPPGPLSEIQTTSTTIDSMKTFLESLYNTTRQTDFGTSSSNLDATASRLVDLLENCRPKKYATTHLWPSVLLRPAWFPTGRPDWRAVGVPKGLPLDQSEVCIEDAKSVDMLDFSVDPGRMNVVEFLKRLDTEGSEAERPWMGKFLESLQSGLEGFIPDQHVVYFRAAKGNIRRPIIESIKRSNDGSECVCRIVFVDAFAPPPMSNPTRLQLLANGLRLAVRTRLEVLDKYRGAMAKESARLRQSEDPVEDLGKRFPLGSRILESIRAIVLEAELQGSRPNDPPPYLFHDDAQQATYERIRSEFKSWLNELQGVIREEDKEAEGKYIKTERLLDELYDMNKKYITIAAPTFLSMLDTSHRQPDGPDDIFVPVRPPPGPGINDPSLPTMRATIGTLCSMIEAGVLGQGGSVAPRLLR
jgi:TIR domain